MITIVGCGTLGSRVAERLDGQKLYLIDHDVVQDRNVDVQRYTKEDVGKLKVNVLSTRHGAKSSAVFIDQTNLELLKDSYVVIDCTDNLLTRKLLGAYCYANGIPLVHGAAAGSRGVVALFDGKPCMASLYAGKVSVDTCRSTDIEPAVADAVAKEQARQALRALEGEDHDGVHLVYEDKQQVAQLSEKSFTQCKKDVPQDEYYVTYCTLAHCMSAKPARPKTTESSEGVLNGIKYSILGNGDIHFHTEAEVDELRAVADELLAR